MKIEKDGRDVVAVQTVELWRDVEGYEIVDFGDPPKDGLAYIGTFGRHIVGRSGRVVPVVYDATSIGGRGLWRRASRQIVDLQGLCRFMSEYGPLGKDAIIQDSGAGQLKVFRPGSRDERKYRQFYIELKRPQSIPDATWRSHIETIQTLTGYVDSLDRDGFLAALGGTMSSGVGLRPRQSDQPWTIELPTLLSLLKYEMWNEFGSDRQSRLALRMCDNCGRAMQVGGRRGASHRKDARFCSDRCRGTSHIRQKRNSAR